jgi:nucleoside-diphosphate-sugar epimerase
MAAFLFGGGMKVLVTGTSGFIGGYLCKRLLDKGHTVAGFARQTNRLGNKAFQELLGKVQMYYGSLTDQHAVRWMVKDFQPDAVFHMGALSPVAYSFDHPQEVAETNYIGTINLAEACLREVPSLKKFCFASSMETYGFQEKREAFVETDAQKPAAPYAVAKVAAEKYVQYLNYAHKFPGVSIRQTNAYGRVENDYFVVEAIITQMLKGNVCNLGEPSPVRNFIFIEDLLDMYEAVLHSGEQANGQVFNSGPDNGLTILELAEKIRKKLNWNGTINWHTRPVRPGEIFYLNSSAEKANRMLGWAPKVELDEGLDRTIAIWRKNLGITQYAGTAYLDQLDHAGCAR